MRARLKCDCFGHALELHYDKRLKMLFVYITDPAQKTKYGVRGWLADVVLYDRPKSKELSKFKKFIAKVKP